MTGDSSLGHLIMENGSEITLNEKFKDGSNSQFNTLTIQGDLTGNGQFNYLTNLPEFKGDKVNVNGNITGAVKLNVKTMGTEPTKTKEHLTLLTAKGNVSQAPKLANTNEVVDLGAFRYSLKTDDKGNYYLWSAGLEKHIDDEAEKEAKEKAEKEAKEKTQQAEFISAYTNLALSAHSAQIQSTLHTVKNLNNRLWNTTPTLEGLWFSHDYAHQKNQSSAYRPYEQNYHILQIGVDKNIDKATGRWLVGGAVSHTNSEQTFDKGSGEQNLTMANLYAQYLSDKQAMLNLNIGYGVVNRTLNLDQQQTKPKQNLAHMGVGIGKTWQLGNVAILPTVSADYYHFAGKNYTLNGANVSQKSLDLLTYQTAVKLSQSFDSSSGTKFSPYITTAYNHVANDAKIDINNYQFNLPIENYWQHKIGLDIQKGAWQGGINLGFIQEKQQKKDFSTGLELSYRW